MKVALIIVLAAMLTNVRICRAADAVVPAPQRAARPTDVAAQPASPLGGSQVTRRCCNLPGALIGAGIGAALGFLFVRNTCDAGDCTSAYIEGMGLLGGLGAAIGAFTAHPSVRSPVRPLGRSSIIVQPVMSRMAVGGVVGIAF